MPGVFVFVGAAFEPWADQYIINCLRMNMNVRTIAFTMGVSDTVLLGLIKRTKRRLQGRII